MAYNNKIKLTLVDDDAVFLKLLEIEFLQQPEYTVETFATGELCIKNLINKPDVIILDYNLDCDDEYALTGMDTLDKIRTINPDIPVVIVSSQDRIKVAINCMQHGAVDYVVKSDTTFLLLRNIIADIFPYKNEINELIW